MSRLLTDTTATDRASRFTVPTVCQQWRRVPRGGPRGRALHATFTEKGINHTWREDPGYGHDYQIWRIYLHDLLQKTFRD